MVVVPHETPRENLPSVKISDLLHGFDELVCFAPIVEHELAAGYPAIHVVDRSRDEQAGTAWHVVEEDGRRSMRQTFDSEGS